MILMSETKIHFVGQYLGIRVRDNWEFVTRINATSVAVLVPVLSADAAGSSSTTSTNGSAGGPSSAPFTPIDVIGPHLETGSDGDRVEQLQEALSALGIDPGPIDGIFGERTKAAVGAFQKAQGIAETGLADEETIRAINTAMQEQG